MSNVDRGCAAMLVGAPVWVTIFKVIALIISDGVGVDEEAAGMGLFCVGVSALILVVALASFVSAIRGKRK